MSEPVFKPPTLTSASQRRAEDMAERCDAWRCARSLLADADIDGEAFDVLQLARFLAGTHDE
jgi:hypothetical protein